MYTEYEKLTLSNSFVFGKVAMQTKYCKIILEALGEECVNIVNLPEREKFIQERLNGKFIRLDLYLEESEKRIINAEMQNYSTNQERQDELPKRSRYYQSLIDSERLDNGEHYLNLKEVHIIFICTFDPFGKGQYKYTFTNQCEELEGMRLEDGMVRIFYNTTGDVADAPNKTKEFFAYLNDGVIESEAMQILEEAVNEVRQNEVWRKEYMNWQMELISAKRDGIIEGKAEGISLIILSQVATKMTKKKPLEQIIDETEQPESVIKPIYSFILENPGKTVEELCELYLKQ